MSLRPKNVRSVVFIVTALVLGMPLHGGTQQCHHITATIEDWTAEPPGFPSTPRAMAAEVQRWNGNEYLWLNDANGFFVYDLADPLTPTLTLEQKLACSGACITEPPAGYAESLYNFSICDECRFGVAQLWIAGTVLFDLGVQTSPSFGPMQLFEAKNTTRGAFTFEHEGQQYLIINRHPGGCGTAPYGSLATVFLFDGIDQIDLVNIQCLELPSGGTVNVANGLYLSNVHGSFVYLVDVDSEAVHIFEITGTGSNLQLQYLEQPMHATSTFGRGLRADKTHDLLVSANVAGAYLWDISDPGNPLLLFPFDNILGNVQVIRAAIRYPFVWLAGGPMGSTFTVDISNISAPQVIDPGFWDPEVPWNSYLYEVDLGAEFSSDGLALYGARYSVAQAISVDPCCVANVTPKAQVVVAPAPVFPGDQVTVTDVSLCDVSRSAIWISDSSGFIVLGSDMLSATTPSSRQFSVPNDIMASDTYWANVAVENDTNPYNPGSPGDQLATQKIDINRSPEVEIEMFPAQPIVGDTVFLTSVAEGSPWFYSWQVETPTGTVLQFPGQQTIDNFDLFESGAWLFEVFLDYRHEDPSGGGFYIAYDELSFSVNSVAADFAVQPSQPCADDSIRLDASTSIIAAGAMPQYYWATDAPPLGDGWAPISHCDGLQTPICDLVPNFFTADQTYDIKLTLENTSNGDISETTRELPVDNCGMYISIVPSTPNIGETVLFTLNNLGGPIDRATWNFGGTGCGGASPNFTCIPDMYSDCRTATFRYSSAGSKTVNAAVLMDGVSYGVPATIVTVANAGSCSGGSTLHPYITASPMSPAAGEPLVLTINGLEGEHVEHTNWDFGAPGCDSDRYDTCVTSDGNICRRATHSYTSPGPKTVLATVRVGGVDYSARPVVPIVLSGTCPVPEPLFADGFESGNTSAWSLVNPNLRNR